MSSSQAEVRSRSTVAEFTLPALAPWMHSASNRPSDAEHADQQSSAGEVPAVPLVPSRISDDSSAAVLRAKIEALEAEELEDASFIMRLQESRLRKFMLDEEDMFIRRSLERFRSDKKHVLLPLLLCDVQRHEATRRLGVAAEERTCWTALLGQITLGATECAETALRCWLLISEEQEWGGLRLQVTLLRHQWATRKIQRALRGFAVRRALFLVRGLQKLEQEARSAFREERLSQQEVLQVEFTIGVASVQLVERRNEWLRSVLGPEEETERSSLDHQRRSEKIATLEANQQMEQFFRQQLENCEAEAARGQHAIKCEEQQWLLIQLEELRRWLSVTVPERDARLAHLDEFHHARDEEAQLELEISTLELVREERKARAVIDRELQYHVVQCTLLWAIPRNLIQDESLQYAVAQQQVLRVWAARRQDFIVRVLRLEHKERAARDETTFEWSTALQSMRSEVRMAQAHRVMPPTKPNTRPPSARAAQRDHQLVQSLRKLADDRIEMRETLMHVQPADPPETETEPPTPIIEPTNRFPVLDGFHALFAEYVEERRMWRKELLSLFWALEKAANEAAKRQLFETEHAVRIEVASQREHQISEWTVELTELRLKFAEIDAKTAKLDTKLAALDAEEADLDAELAALDAEAAAMDLFDAQVSEILDDDRHGRDVIQGEENRVYEEMVSEYFPFGSFGFSSGGGPTRPGMRRRMTVHDLKHILQLRELQRQEEVSRSYVEAEEEERREVAQDEWLSAGKWVRFFEKWGNAPPKCKDNAASRSLLPSLMSQKRKVRKLPDMSPLAAQAACSKFFTESDAEAQARSRRADSKRNLLEWSTLNNEREGRTAIAVQQNWSILGRVQWLELVTRRDIEGHEAFQAERQMTTILRGGDTGRSADILADPSTRYPPHPSASNCIWKYRIWEFVAAEEGARYRLMLSAMDGLGSILSEEFEEVGESLLPAHRIGLVMALNIGAPLPTLASMATRCLSQASARARWLQQAELCHRAWLAAVEHYTRLAWRVVPQ